MDGFKMINNFTQMNKNIKGSKDEYIEKHRTIGKLTARERINKLLDIY